MADYANVEAELSGLDEQGRRVLKSIFRYILRDIRFGRAEDGDASKNFGGGFFIATTPAIANEEFTVTHTFGRTPYLLIPVLPLDTAGAKLVRLEVARAADANRIYLKSPDTDAPIRFYLEG